MKSSEGMFISPSAPNGKVIWVDLDGAEIRLIGTAVSGSGNFPTDFHSIQSDLSVPLYFASYVVMNSNVYSLSL